MKKIDDEKILAALISCGSVRTAAKSANISESTIRNRLCDPVFRERYEIAKAAILQESCDALTARLTLAIDTLSAVLEDNQNAATVRISAADAVLRHGLRYIEAANILRRLEALEEVLKEDSL